MLRVIRFWISALFLVSACALAFWNCNLSDPKGPTLLRLTLADTLSKAHGYDSILVDIYDGNGKLFLGRVFAGPYDHVADSAKLANIQLPDPVPDPMLIRINAYKDTIRTLEFDITITNGTATHRDTIYVAAAVPDTTIKSITITNPSPLLLHVGGQPVALTATVLPAASSQAVNWALETPGVAEIVGGNQIKGLKAGTAKVIATSVAKASISTTLDVIVDSVAIKPVSISLLMATPLTLSVGGPDADLIARVLPAGASQEVLWSSSDSLTVEITAAHKAKALKTGKATLTVKSKADASIDTSFEVNVIVPVKVDGITISPSVLSLYTGGEDGKLTVTMATNDSAAHYGLSSSDPAVASVSADGTIKAWKPGKANITASVVGYPAIAAVCSVTVATDPPFPAITPDQTIAYGAEAAFDVTVTQSYGNVAEIKADMDGDGVYEQSVLGKTTAQFKAKYSQIKTYNLSFVVRDGEGNSVEIRRTVKVNAPVAPTVDIIDPAADITINQLSYTIRFSIKDPSQGIDTTKDSTVTLADGPNVVSASRTNAGGIGKDQVTITVNRSAPGVPVIAAQARYTNNKSPIWTWSLVSGAAKYQVRLNDADFTKATGNIEKTDLSYSLPASSDGDYTLYVRSVDALGNASSAASQTVTIDTKAPDTVSFAGTDNSFTDDATPTWKWSPSKTNGGINSYEVTLDNAPTPIIVNDTLYTPSTALADNQIHTLSVRQKDRVDGVLGATKAFRYQVVVNAPAAPVVSGPSGVANNGRTNKLNFSWVGGARGIDTYRIKVNSEATFRETANTSKTFSLAANTVDGTYTVHVQELDGAGRWGDEGTLTIVLDRTGPSIAFTTRNNFITNTSPAKIDYKVDGVAAPTVNCVLAKSNQANTCSVSAADDLGNTTQTSITVFYRPYTYFVTATGIGNGSSWENASSEIGGYSNDATKKWKEVWVASGTYKTVGGAYQGIGLADSLTILGGFDATVYPTNSDNRNKSNTFVGGINGDGGFPQDPPRVTGYVDGFVLTGTLYLNNGCALTISDSKFENADPNVEYLIFLNNRSILNTNNIVIANRTFRTGAVYIPGGCEANLSGGAIINNTINGSADDAITILVQGKLKLSGGFNLYGNGNSNGGGVYQIHAFGTEELQVDSSVNMNCASILKVGNPDGTFVDVPGSCKGNPI